MKKVVNVLEEKAESLETNKRITKNVSENIHKVDSIISSVTSSSSLFNIQAVSARMRLRESCERAIMTGPNTLTQRIEEILWRKVYYEPLSAAKKMRKGSAWSEVEGGLIWAHLNDGIAFYHHHLMSLVSSSSNPLQFIADLLPVLPHSDENSIKSSKDDMLLHETLCRTLTCLGDLARYMLDIPSQISNKNAYLLSVRYYHQALHYNCEGGLTHSNLATVYSTNNHPLLAAVHYLRAITCEKPFEAAENNLKRMLEKSRIWLENKKMEKENGKEEDLEKKSIQFLHTCLALLSCFINNRRMEEVAVLCQDVLLQLGKLLDDYDNVEPPDLSETDPPVSLNLKTINGCVDLPLPGKSSADSAEKKMPSKDNENGFLLTPESMVTLCALFIICVKRLKMQGSPHSNMSEVLLISILLTLVSHINTRLEQRYSLIDPAFVQKLLPAQEQNLKSEVVENTKEKEDATVCNGEKTKKNGRGKMNKLSKLRRKCNKGIEDEDSEAEGNECEERSNESCSVDEGSSSSCDEADAFDPSVLCSSEDDDSDEDVKIECEEEWKGMTEEEQLHLVEQEGMLAAVNVTLHWLFTNEQMIKMCGRTAHNLWSSLEKLFTLIRVDFDKLIVPDASAQKKEIVRRLKALKAESFCEDGGLERAIDALPEYVMLHLVIPSFHRSNAAVSFKPSDLNLLRLYRLNCTMFHLCSSDDVPLKLKGDLYVTSEEKVKSIAEKAKLEPMEGRSTPAANTPSHHSSVSSTPPPVPRPDDAPGGRSDDGCLSGLSTPKRSLSSRVTAASMQSLTAQWLQHEVRSLEETTARRTKLGGLYLVPDASVLIHRLATIKQLLAAPSHMVIIPQVVIDSLDQQKRDSLGARDAIRWLEVKLRHGSRFMRAQRPHEKSHLPLIKYPKRKDKEAWEWFHVAECCYYLGAQMNKTDPKTCTVTLLTTETWSKTAKRSFSLHTLAEAAGAGLQTVDEFIQKWHISSKGHS